jgi:hypothetical protein
MNERRAAQVLREACPGSGDRVLVAVLKEPRDLEIARTQGWYRIPVKRAPRRVGADYLAFYMTGAFPPGERHRILFYAPIHAYRLATRAQLLPQEADHPRTQDLYFRIEIGPLQRLEPPIVSHKLRRITFISTRLDRLLSAREVVELWDKERHPEEVRAALQTEETE